MKVRKKIILQSRGLGLAKHNKEEQPVFSEHFVKRCPVVYLASSDTGYTLSGGGGASLSQGGKQQHILNCATIFSFRNSPQCKLIAQRSVYQLYPWSREYATRAIYIY